MKKWIMFLVFMLTFTSMTTNVIAESEEISLEELEKVEEVLRQEGVKDADIKKTYK